MHALVIMLLFAILGGFCGQGWARLLAPTPGTHRQLVGATSGAICTFLLLVVAGASLASPLPFIATVVALPFGYFMSR